MTDPAHKPTFGDTVTIETVGSDSAVQRSSHAVARALLRPALELLARIAARHPTARTHGFRAANFIELAAYPLRPSRGTRRRIVMFEQFRAEWLWHKIFPIRTRRRRAPFCTFTAGRSFSEVCTATGAWPHALPARRGYRYWWWTIVSFRWRISPIPSPMRWIPTATCWTAGMRLARSCSPAIRLAAGWPSAPPSRHATRAYRYRGHSGHFTVGGSRLFGQARPSQRGSRRHAVRLHSLGSWGVGHGSR